PELWRHTNEVLAVASEYFQPNIAISITQSFVHKLLHALVASMLGPQKALAVMDGLLAGCETKTAIVNRELHELAQLAGRSPVVRQELLDHGGRDFWNRHLANADGASDGPFADFAAAFRRFLEDHGHRELDMDCRLPTWADCPQVVLDSLALI